MPLRRSRQDGTEHGGFYALLGYTQQMLGTAEQFVRCLTPAPPAGATDWEICQSFEIETLGQDATLVSRRLVLTQYKFSLKPDEHKIGPTELDKISKSFQKSEEHCKKLSVEPTEKLLRSNRQLSPTAKPHKYGIDFERYDPVEARFAVESYAKEFGICEPAELDASVKRVLGELILAGADPRHHRITKERFDELMTGSGRPLPLVISKAVPYIQKALDRCHRNYLGEELVLTPREQFLNAINNLDDDALVLITGKGGCGKSTALLQLLRIAADDLSKSPRLARFVSSSPGAPATFGDVVDELRGIPAPQMNDRVALRRIEAANPGSQPPLLLLGWDGIDQVHPSDGWLASSRRVIEFFWEIHQEYKGTGRRPPARLLVTCRQKNEIDQHIGTITGLGVSGRPPQIEVDVFSDSELRHLIGSVEPVCAARLAAALDSNPMPELGSEFTSHLGSDDRFARKSIEVLKYPIMWHCFSRLDAGLQLGFLNGDSEAFAAVAESYLNWFKERVNQRHGLDKEDVEGGLDQLAKGFPSVTNTSTKIELLQCLSAVFGSEADKGRFYREGISSGLLDEMPPPGGRIGFRQDRWRWRHDFVVRHLLKRQGHYEND